MRVALNTGTRRAQRLRSARRLSVACPAVMRCCYGWPDLNLGDVSRVMPDSVPVSDLVEADQRLAARADRGVGVRFDGGQCDGAGSRPRTADRRSGAPCQSRHVEAERGCEVGRLCSIDDCPSAMAVATISVGAAVKHLACPNRQQGQQSSIAALSRVRERRPSCLRHRRAE